jgi:hypothetical protein
LIDTWFEFPVNNLCSHLEKKIETFSKEGNQMNQKVYRYRIDRKVLAKDFEETFCLALIATESLHGPALVWENCKYKIDSDSRTITIDVSNHIASDLAKLFLGLYERAYGVEAISFERHESAELQEVE